MSRLLTFFFRSLLPGNVYVAEDGTSPYVAENGATYYVKES